MCQNYLLFDEEWGSRIQTFYAQDPYFSFIPMRKPLHPSAKLAGKYLIHVESGFPLSGIGMKERMEKETANLIHKKNRYYYSLITQIVEDHERMVSFDLTQWVGLLKELFMDLAIPCVGLLHTVWPDEIPSDEPLLGPISYSFKTFDRELLYALPSETMVILHAE